jgi:hypothetical protein
MYIDREILQEYPFEGEFYRTEITDSPNLVERVEQEIVTLTTPCDIQQANSSTKTNFISATYTIYIPFDKDIEKVTIRRGDLFRADMYGLMVDGKVIGVFPTQLGGITVYVEDVTR